MTVRGADSDRFFEDSRSFEVTGETGAPSPQDIEALERVVREAVGELYECPRCARILWRRREDEDYRVYAPEPRATI